MVDQIRELEFLLEGARDLSSMGVIIRLPDGGMRIGEQCILELTLNHDPAHEPGNITPIRSSGLSITDEPLSPRSVDGVEDGRSIYVVPVIPGGDPGESGLKVVIKGGDFRATVGISDMVIDVRPFEMEIFLQDHPYIWDGSGDLEIGIGVGLPDEERLKGVLSISLTNSLGERIELRSGSEKKVKFRGPSVLSHRIALAAGSLSDDLDIHLDLSSRYGRMRRTVEGAIKPPSSDVLRADIPSSIAQGEMIRIILHTDEQEVQSASISLNIDVDGSSSILRPSSVEGSEDGVEATFQPSAGMMGDLHLRLHYDDVEIASVPLSIIDSPPVIIKDIRCQPGQTSRGSVVKFILSYEPGDDPLDDIRADVIVGGKKGERFSIDIDPSARTVEHSFTVPRSMPEGDNPCEVSIVKGGEMIFREVRSRVLKVAEVSSLTIDVATPQDLLKGSDTRYSSYMMPGEKVSGTEGSHDLDVIKTTTGRRMLVYKDQVMWGKDWSENRTDDVLGIYLLQMFGGTIIERDMASGIERSVELLGMSSFWAGADYNQDVSFDLAGFLKGKEKVISPGGDIKLPPFTGNMVRFLFGNNGKNRKDEKKQKRAAKSGSTVKNDLFTILRNLLDGGGLMDENIDPVSSLKKTVEGSIKEMKGGEKELPADIGHSVIRALLGRLHRSMRILLKTDKRDSLDLDGWRTHIHEIMFDLIALTLIRAEIISNWSDPAIFSWDELRVLRQRSLKREITTALDLVEMYGRVYRTSRERMASLRSNMEIRRTMKGLSSIRSSGDSSLRGMAGETWTGKMRLRVDGSGSDITLRGCIFLPSGNWQIISPKADGSGINRDIGDLIIPGGSDLSMDIELRPPRDFSGGARAVLYLYPPKTRLEVEP